MNEIRDEYSRESRKDGIFLLTMFFQKVYTLIVAVLAMRMIPYEFLPTSDYFENEQKLMSLYNPQKKAPQTIQDKTYGTDTFFGSAFCLLKIVRDLFNSN